MVEPDPGERLPVTHTRHLPQLDGGMFLTDGGLETDMIFNRGRDLPLFAAFTLLETEDGTDELRRYYEPYLELAAEHELGFVLESPTWRASPRWAAELGMSDERLGELNRKSIELIEELRSNAPDGVGPIMISGQIGPQDDGYNPSARLSADEARDYHSTQIETFAETEADLVTALTMTYVEEALGVTRAAAAASIPVVISFTVETDGRLPSGQSLAEAIEQADAETDSGPAYYMINCAHRRTSTMSCRARASGSSGSSACGRTPRPRATPSSTRQPSSTRAIPRTSASATRRSPGSCRT